LVRSGFLSALAGRERAWENSAPVAQSVSYRGMLFFQTNSQKIALGSGCGAFEYEVDAAGSTTSKIW
jgi:hypothetical protein